LVTDTNESILIPQKDFFPNERSLFNWRDTKATPDLLTTNPVFQDIRNKTEILIEESGKTLGGMYKDFVIPHAVATAVRKTLKYDSTKAKIGSILPFN
jgi:hypothetical protein